MRFVRCSKVSCVRPCQSPIESRIPRSVCTVVFLAICIHGEASILLWAGEQPIPNTIDQPGTVAVPSPFVADARRSLAKMQEQISGLASRSLAILDTPGLSQDQALNQQITAKSAEATYDNAKLTREVAEIAILEYEQGIFKQDEATAMGELKLEETALSRAGDMIEYAKGRLAEIKKASRGSAADLANEYTYEDKIIEFERREPIARRAVEKARSKLKMLQEFTRPKHVKELQAAVEIARAEELGKQARLGLETAKLKELQEPVKTRERPTREQHILALLDQAIPIEERLQAKLTQAETDQGPGEALRKEVADLTNQFQGLIERALAEEVAATWARLKPSIHQAVGQAAGKPPK
jgi:hypothetical protein